MTKRAAKRNYNLMTIIYVLSNKDVNFLNSILVADALNILKQTESEELYEYFRQRNLDRFQCKSLQMLAKQSLSSSIKFVKSKYLPSRYKAYRSVRICR